MKDFIKEQLSLLDQTHNPPKYDISFRLTSQQVLGKCSFFPKTKVFRISFNFKVLGISTQEKVLKVIKHEYAHMLNILRNGINVKGHGKEWKTIMKELGEKKAKARTSDFQNESILAYEEYTGKCKCSVHPLTKKMFKNIEEKSKKYICPLCSKKIKI